MSALHHNEWMENEAFENVNSLIEIDSTMTFFLSIAFLKL